MILSVRIAVASQEIEQCSLNKNVARNGRFNRAVDQDLDLVGVKLAASLSVAFVFQLCGQSEGLGKIFLMQSDYPARIVESAIKSFDEQSFNTSDRYNVCPSCL